MVGIGETIASSDRAARLPIAISRLNTYLLATQTRHVPLLQFDTTLSLSAEEKSSLADRVTDIYIAEMATTTGHVAVTIRERDSADLHLGRAVDGPLVFLDADVRRGRSFEQKRTFALETFAYFGESFDIPDQNMKVVFTEHSGESMMGVDRVGGEWGDE